MKSKLVIKIIQTETETGASLLEKKGMFYSFLNPVSYLDALKHKELFGQMDGLFADGSLLVAAIKLCYGTKVTRRSLDMTSIGKDVLEVSGERGKSIYIVKKKKKVTEMAISQMSGSKTKKPGISLS